MLKRLRSLLKDLQLYVFLGYFFLVVLLGWYWQLRTVWWFIGGVVGWVLVFLDRIVWAYWTRPETQLAVTVRYLIDQKKVPQAINTLWQRKREQKELTFRSALFQGVWLVLAFFTLTSTPGWFSKGLVMGLGLHILYDGWKDYLKSPEMFRDQVFWQIKRQVSLKETKYFLWGVTFGFGLLTLILI